MDLDNDELKATREMTANEIEIMEKHAYYRGRADEELRWKDVKDDLTTVYMNGFYDGEKKWKYKIIDKIKELEEQRYILSSKHNEISILRELLGE